MLYKYKQVIEEHSYETFKPICPVRVKDRHSACDRKSFLPQKKKKLVVKLYNLVTEIASSTAEWLSLKC